MLVKSPFSPFSGYGADGLGMLRALVKWGCDVYVQPTWVDTPIPRDLLPLFGKSLSPPFDLAINHWDPGNLGIGIAPRQATRLAIAWTMWEFDNPPGRTIGAFFSNAHAGLATLKERLKWYDLVLGYDPVTMKAIAPYCAPHTGRGVLQGGYEAADWKPAERDWFGERFGFVMHGALNMRKCPWTAIQAFNELKYEHPEEFAGATLSLHNTIGGIPQELEEAIPRTRVYQQTFSAEDLARFYGANHVLLAPSLGEGKNLPALEMLATGGTVIATDFGGHKMWPLGEVGWPLPYTLRPLIEGRPRGPHAAVVSVADLKDAMWEAYTNRGEAKRRGEMGTKLIPQQCDWNVVIEHLWERIRDLVPHNGALIYDMAHRCRRQDWGRDPKRLLGG